MTLDECIRTICILAIIFGYTFLFLLLWILSVLKDIRKELKVKKNECN